MLNDGAVDLGPLLHWGRGSGHDAKSLVWEVQALLSAHEM